MAAVPKSSRWSVVAAIALFVSLVVGPVLLAYWPKELAKWYLAAAALTQRQATGPGDPKLEVARSYLEKAFAADPSLRQRVQLNPSEGAYYNPVIDEQLWLEVSELMTRGMEREAIDLIERVQPDAARRRSELNNSYAYASALAGSQLEEALHAIDLAIAEKPISTYLDTKAWVLYRLERYDVALQMAQKSIRLLYEEFDEILANSNLPAAELETKRQEITAYRESDPLSKLEVAELLQSLDASPPDAKESLSENDEQSVAEEQESALIQDLLVEIGEAQKRIAKKKFSKEALSVIEHHAVYRRHRADILAKIGQQELANAEREVLEAFGFTYEELE